MQAWTKSAEQAPEGLACLGTCLLVTPGHCSGLWHQDVPLWQQVVPQQEPGRLLCACLLVESDLLQGSLFQQGQVLLIGADNAGGNHVLQCKGSEGFESSEHMTQNPQLQASLCGKHPPRKFEPAT